MFEFAYGGELYTLMKKRGKLPEEEARFYFAEIAMALHYLHNRMGIVYRYSTTIYLVIRIIFHIAPFFLNTNV